LNNKELSYPQADLLSAWSSELVDWWGRSVSQRDKRVIGFNGKHWFVKFKPDPEEQKRDYLAYILGRNWANVAEVLPLSESEFGDLRQFGVYLPEWATMMNTNLIRLVGDYTIDQLPNIDINEAVASELVFSLWIRRRDTHAANRAYISSVPVFFDHQTAFLGEPHLGDPNLFFHRGRDAGHAGRWRVEVIRHETIISTSEIRQIGWARDIALHFVRDLSRFNNCVKDAVERVQRQNREEWFQAARTAGYSETRADEITTFLEKNCTELDVAVEKMRTVIFWN